MNTHCHKVNSKTRDTFFLFNLFSGILLYLTHLLNVYIFQSKFHYLQIPHTYYNLINTMALGIFLGILFMGLLGKISQEYIYTLIGKPGSKSGLLKAALAGILLDLCSHGILMVGLKLYQKGASIGQVMAFLIASPWNSLSLTFVLISLIGFKWTILFILLSVFIALITGLLFEALEKNHHLPQNPYTITFKENFHFIQSLKKDFSQTQINFKLVKEIIFNGLKESRMILRWILFGTLLSTLITFFIDTQTFQNYFGPSLLGLGATLFFATIIEVCSEGSAPIAADLINRADALGNGFTFLMAGVSTDYTEIMAVKETTKSWKISLLLPILTIPQILTIAYFLNKL